MSKEDNPPDYYPDNEQRDISTEWKAAGACLTMDFISDLEEEELSLKERKKQTERYILELTAGMRDYKNQWFDDAQKRLNKWSH